MGMRRVSAAWLLALSVYAMPGAAAGDARLSDAVKSGNRVSCASCCAPRRGRSRPETDGTTPLHWAVRADDLETVQRC